VYWKWQKKSFYIIIRQKGGKKMNDHVIAELAICPLGTGSTEVSTYIRSCLDIVKNAKGTKYELNSMGTTIEGPMSVIMDIFIRMNEVPFSMGAKRVYSIIKIDDRRDKEASIEHKMKAVS
jgi:uncharacterized protein (TIGR00106 family)